MPNRKRKKQNLKKEQKERQRKKDKSVVIGHHGPHYRMCKYDCQKRSWIRRLYDSIFE
jgi:hypothetical protein